MTLLKLRTINIFWNAPATTGGAGNEWKFSELAKIQIRFRFSGGPVGSNSVESLDNILDV